MYPKNEKYLKKYLKYFSINLYLKVFVFIFESLKSICILIHLNVFDPMSANEHKQQESMMYL